jgi:hypothetical protein
LSGYLQVVEDGPRRSARSDLGGAVLHHLDVVDELVGADVVVVQVARAIETMMQLGVNVRITIFSDFSQIFEKKLAFFLKTSVLISYCTNYENF